MSTAGTQPVAAVVTKTVALDAKATKKVATKKVATKKVVKRKVTVSATLSASRYLKGAKVKVTGYAKGASKGTHVTLQRKTTVKGKARWVKVASSRTSTASGHYSIAFRASSGSTYPLRTVVAATARTKAATSKTRTLKHTSCGTTAAKPTKDLAVWFNDPTRASSGALGSNLRSLICATAPGATVRVSMYILQTGDAEAEKILSALRYVHTERGVTVKFVVESGTGGVGGVSAASIKELRRFASVATCKDGCFNTASSSAQSHDKIIAISRMRWSGRSGPVLVVESTNWSDRQLLQYWQSATVFYADRTFYDAAVARFDRAVQCGAGRCSAIRSAGGLSWVTANGNWGMAGDPILSSAKGSGLTYRFFPAVTKRDNVLDTLRGVSGCSKGGSIRVAMYAASGSRPDAIGEELGRLRRAGCSVSILVSQGGAVTTPQDKVAMYKAASGVAPRCVELMHLKFAVLQGVNQKVGTKTLTGQTMILDGSQNWTAAGLKRNDETTFVLSTSSAGAARAKQIRALATSYVKQWTTVAKHTQTCGTIR